jgi:hypothetical protein
MVASLPQSIKKLFDGYWQLDHKNPKVCDFSFLFFSFLFLLLFCIFFLVIEIKYSVCLAGI